MNNSTNKITSTLTINFIRREARRNLSSQLVNSAFYIIARRLRNQQIRKKFSILLCNCYSMWNHIQYVFENDIIRTR